MCRSIKTLFNFEPPATGSARQLVASLVTPTAPKNRDHEAEKARAQWAAQAVRHS